ncbi:MAG: hypothetical protein QOD86_2792 [Miltoncostaeaceae bacterium]|nr:hypothetical protein [Miltoncostaeaceae bacterium]
MQIETFSWRPGVGWSTPALGAIDSERTLVVAFGDPDLGDDPAPIRELAAAFPRSTVIGCSTAGQILGSEVSDGGLAVAAARFERTTITHATARIAGAEGSRAAGRELATELAGPDLRTVFVLSEGLQVNGSELVRGLASVLPESVVVTGGLAGDADRFARTWVLVDGEPVTGHACAVGLSGPAVRVGHGSRGGWDHFGIERRITRSAGNVLYELDGRPALALYKSYLGELASGLPATGLLFPLALRGEDGGQVVRTILAVDEATQSMTFAGDMPEGVPAQLMMGTVDRLVAGAAEAAAGAGDEPGDGPTLAIAVSCVGRRLLMDERIEEETVATLEMLPRGAAQVGFYSYGELSPGATGFCDLHNQTMTITTIREDGAE